MSSLQHMLKAWEKKYGYLGLSSEERELFSSVKDKRFSMKIMDEELFSRKIDWSTKTWRIWVSHSPLKDLAVGDVLVISKDEKGNYSITKK